MIRRLMDQRGSDEGSAIVEFTLVAVLIMVPLVYLVVAVASIQRVSSAAADAARAAGRALGSAGSVQEGLERAQAAVAIALDDAGLAEDAAQLRIVPTSAACDEPQVEPTLAPGAAYAVCVIVVAPIPGVPSVLGGGQHTAIGRYVVHVDDFRSTG